MCAMTVKEARPFFRQIKSRVPRVAQELPPQKKRGKKIKKEARRESQFLETNTQALGRDAGSGGDESMRDYSGGAAGTVQR